MERLRIHYLQHAPFEGLGCMEDWAAGHILTATHCYAGEPMPDSSQLDLLIIMGGPMGAYEETKYPWLKAEKACIREAVREGKKVLGICLGAQLIASALGARVYPHRYKEIGWYPVFPTALDHSRECLHHILLDNPMVFHWHSDTFDLPPDAVNHAYSEACHQQLFTIGHQVMGIQFHFEVRETDIRSMIEQGQEELGVGQYVQSEFIILQGLRHARQSTLHMQELLTDFISSGRVPASL